MNRLLLMLVAAAAGAMLPLQAALNARVSRAAEAPVLAALTSFLVGTAALVVFVFSTGNLTLDRVRAVGTAPPWALGAGLLGAFYVATTVLLVPRLGVALTFAVAISGQMLVSLLFDQFGLFGVPVQPANLNRLLGVGLLVAGVALLLRK